MAALALKSQSAMEYLMTYGWAILVIAVVLASLYQLGIFNSSNSAPRAQPGSCKVFRPNGPGTTAFINLVGLCNNQLPQFVGSFDGASSYVSVPYSSSLMPTTAITLSAWAKWSSYATNHYTSVVFMSNPAEIGGCDTNYALSSYYATPLRADFFLSTTAGGTCQHHSGATTLALNTWYFIVGTYDSSTGNAILYVNGKVDGSATYSGTISATTNSVLMGGGFDWFNGKIADVQIYNTSLDAGEIQSLYAEGIGGAPVSPQYLVGWWPLNGNVTDYSGNNNNGAATSVSYTSSWTSGYQGH